MAALEGRSGHVVEVKTRAEERSEEGCKGIMESKKRGRPRRIKEETVEAAYMHKFLASGGTGYELVFGKGRKMERSPVDTREKQDMAGITGKVDRDVSGAEAEGQASIGEGRRVEEGASNGKESTETDEAAKAASAAARVETEQETKSPTAAANAAVGEAAVCVYKREPYSPAEKTGTAARVAGCELKAPPETDKELVKGTDDIISILEKRIKELEGRLYLMVAEKVEQSKELKNLKLQMENEKRENSLRLATLEEEIANLKKDFTERNIQDMRIELSGKLSGSVCTGTNSEVIQCNKEIQELVPDTNINRVREINVNQIKRDYLDKFPEALGDEEYKWEMAERRRRKNNIFIRGIRTIGSGLIQEINEIILNKLKIAINIKKVRAIGGGLVVELYELKNKIEIMKKRKLLENINIWIEDDLTEREKEIQEWLGNIAEEENRNGLETQTGYLKVKVNGSWYGWNETKGQLEEQLEKFFRSR